jgi:ABC-type phosphate transport system substrate-binding protein
MLDRFVRVLLLLGLSALLVACEGAAVATPPRVTLTIAGSTSMAPVLTALTDAYTRQHPNVVFDLRGGGSTLGEAAIRAGRYDLVASTLFPARPGSRAPGAPRRRSARPHADRHRRAGDHRTPQQ